MNARSFCFGVGFGFDRVAVEPGRAGAHRALRLSTRLPSGKRTGPAEPSEGEARWWRQLPRVQEHRSGPREVEIVAATGYTRRGVPFGPPRVGWLARTMMTVGAVWLTLSGCQALDLPLDTTHFSAPSLALHELKLVSQPSLLQVAGYFCPSAISASLCTIAGLAAPLPDTMKIGVSPRLTITNPNAFP